MKPEILKRLQELGGNVTAVKGQSLEADLCAITFDTVLYQWPEDTPWQGAEDAEPIYGIGAFVEENEALYKSDEKAFYEKMTARYFCLTEEGFGQFFWQPELFTPFRKGTADYEEWNSDFAAEEADLSEITERTNDQTPDFIKLFYSYGFPDAYYVCLSDPEPGNPMLFSTDHEVFFREVTNEGDLEAFLNTFMTQAEVRQIVKQQLEK